MLVIRMVYRKAGRVWGWSPPFRPEGVGVDCRLFDGVGELVFRVNDLCATFSIDKMVVRKFVRDYQSIERIGDVTLWVFPLELCEPLDRFGVLV